MAFESNKNNNEGESKDSILKSLKNEKNEDNFYKSFEDYPKDIQEEALEVLENENLIDFFQEIVGILHEGDEKAGELILLSIASLFIENTNSIHEVLKGFTSAGKSSLTKKAVKLVPRQYVQEIRNSSPKYIYYAVEKNSYHANYNIFVFDDIKLSIELIEVIKTLTDNIQIKKTLKTVKDQKVLELELPGKCLVIMNLAKEITDNELNNRLFYNNPQEDKVHEFKSKEMIRDNQNMGLDFKNENIRRLYLISNAVMQYIIDKKVKVFNPYIDLLDLSDKNKRDVGYTVDLIKSNTFYNLKNREKINDIYIGSVDDLNKTIELWNSISLRQQFKLDYKQCQMIEMLPEYSDEYHSELKKYYDNDRHSINFTFVALAKKFGVSNKTIKNWVLGRADRESNRPSLEDQGLVKAMKLDPSLNNSPYVLYKGDNENLENILNSSRSDGTIGTSEENDFFNNKNVKKKIIYGFLNTDTNIKNIYNEKKLDEFLESHDNSIKSYKDLCKFIEDSIQYLKNFNIENEKNENLSYKDLLKYFSNGFSKYGSTKTNLVTNNVNNESI